MPDRDLLQAWIGLVVLSMGTVLLATVGTSGAAAIFVVLGVLVLAGLKARVILAYYLGLAPSRFWMRLFGMVIGLFLALCFALYVFGSQG